MRARTEPKSYGAWEAYLCNGRHSGRTNCTIPALSREEIDRAVWHHFETVGLDYDAMVREDEERRSLRLAEIAAQVEAARAELRLAEERLERVRRDYLDGKLTAEHWEDFLAHLEPEGEAAAAALEQLRGQADATRSEATLRDAEAETIAALRAWGAQTRSSRCSFVFVEQAAEEVASSELERMNGRCRRRIGFAAAIRRAQVERSVGDAAG